MKKLSNINERKVCGIFMMVMLATVLMTCPALAATTNNFDNVVNPVIALLNSLLGPILGLVGAVGTLYCVLLGVKFAKAEEPQEREKAKAHLKNAIIGFVLIFVLIVALKVGMKAMTDWLVSQEVKVTDIPTGVVKSSGTTGTT